MANADGRDSLDPEVNKNVVAGRENKAVSQYLEIIANNQLAKAKQDDRNRAIQDLFESSFLISSPDGTRKLNAQRLYQALWRTASRMKPLDFTIHGPGSSRDVESVVTDGVWTVMDRGGYDSALRDKNGAFFNLLMYGDGFMQVGSNPGDSDEVPIVWNPISGRNLFTDNYATGIRTKGWGRNATKVVVIFSYSWGELIDMYPDAKSKAGIGKIPRDLSAKDQERTSEQETLLTDEVEVAYAYDIRNKNFTVFAGSECTVLEELNGDDYPFVMKDKAYIPVSQFICMPSSEGFWNHGIGAMVYKLAIISRRLMNMEVNHIEDNTYPIELVSVPQGEAANFFNKLQAAHKMRASGKKGFVPVERDSTDPNGSVIGSQTLTTQNLFNEWQAVFDRLDREIRRLGINIDELETSSGTTATEILALEENANSFVKQVMEYNASESQFMVELTLDFITQFVSKKNKSQLNLTTTLQSPGGATIRADGFTLGQLANTLKGSDYFVRVNSRTGAIPSKALERAQLADGLRLAAPGSAAQVQLIGQMARLNDIDIVGQDFVAPAQPAAVEVEEAPAAATDRLTVSAQSDQVAAI